MELGASSGGFGAPSSAMDAEQRALDVARRINMAFGRGADLGERVMINPDALD